MVRVEQLAVPTSKWACAKSLVRSGLKITVGNSTSGSANQSPVPFFSYLASERKLYLVHQHVLAV